MVRNIASKVRKANSDRRCKVARKANKKRLAAIRKVDKPYSKWLKKKKVY